MRLDIVKQPFIEYLLSIEVIVNDKNDHQIFCELRDE
jgi:hypothetical protein